MNKYLAVSRITLSNVVQYRVEYVIAQIRTVVHFLTLFFLWTKIFTNRAAVFGFTQEEIIFYVVTTAFFAGLVVNSAADQIASELQSWGKFFSYLIKPIGYFRYWFTVDIVYKLTYAVSTLIILTIIISVLNINIAIPLKFLNVILFLLSISIAFLTYFYLAAIISTIGFWTSQVWGLQFFLVLIVEFSAGVYFPIDVLPKLAQTIVSFTPFPYLLYFPIKILLGKMTFQESFIVIAISLVWLTFSYTLSKIIFAKGIKSYEAWGG